MLLQLPPFIPEQQQQPSSVQSRWQPNPLQRIKEARHLPTNPEFRAYGNTLMAALDFMLDNLDDTSVITQMLKGKNWQSYFAPGVSINQQLVVRILAKFILH